MRKGLCHIPIDITELHDIPPMLSPYRAYLIPSPMRSSRHCYIPLAIHQYWQSADHKLVIQPIEVPLPCLTMPGPGRRIRPLDLVNVVSTEHELYLDGNTKLASCHQRLSS